MSVLTFCNNRSKVNLRYVKKITTDRYLRGGAGIT
jgi:hypothetical protein